VQVPVNEFCPKVALANVPLRNQLNVFLIKAGLKPDYSTPTDSSIVFSRVFQAAFDRRREVEHAEQVHALRNAVEDFNAWLERI